MLKSPRDLLPVLTGVLLSLIALLSAWAALSSLSERDYGNALIFAGGAIAFGVLPLSRMSRADLGKSLGELALEAIRKPEPMPMRIAIGFAWILVLAGIASFFL